MWDGKPTEDQKEIDKLRFEHNTLFDDVLLELSQYVLNSFNRDQLDAFQSYTRLEGTGNIIKGLIAWSGYFLGAAVGYRTKSFEKVAMWAIAHVIAFGAYHMAEVNYLFPNAVTRVENTFDLNDKEDLAVWNNLRAYTLVHIDEYLPWVLSSRTNRIKPIYDEKVDEAESQRELYLTIRQEVANNDITFLKEMISKKMISDSKLVSKSSNISELDIE